MGMLLQSRWNREIVLFHYLFHESCWPGVPIKAEEAPPRSLFILVTQKILYNVSMILSECVGKGNFHAGVLCCEESLWQGNAISNCWKLFWVECTLNITQVWTGLIVSLSWTNGMGWNQMHRAQWNEAPGMLLRLFWIRGTSLHTRSMGFLL